MSISEEQFNTAKNKLSQASMSREEKTFMVNTIYERYGVEGGKSWVDKWSLYMAGFQHRALASAFAFMLLLTSTTYVSARSLPGDVLYSMRVHLLEPLGLVESIEYSEDTAFQMNAGAPSDGFERSIFMNEETAGESDSGAISDESYMENLPHNEDFSGSVMPEDVSLENSIYVNNNSTTTAQDLMDVELETEEDLDLYGNIEIDEVSPLNDVQELSN